MPQKTQFCFKGHDTAILGRANGNCIACRRSQDKAKHRDYHLQNLYGITLEQYNGMFAAQNGLCKGCYRHQSTLKRALNVDHNHSTGEIRGLLCDGCNIALGAVRENKEVLTRLVSYLGGK